MADTTEETKNQELRLRQSDWQTKVLGRAIFKHGYLTAAAKKAIRQLRAGGMAPKLTKKPR